MRIAFYAPLKAPEHPVPSGDRTMARALLKALDIRGHAVTRPSDLRTFLPVPDRARQHGLSAEAWREIERISDMWSEEDPPDAWFTYHNHYKAPDLLGPEVARRFGLAYVVAEASHAAKRAADWTTWHVSAEAAIRSADLLVCFTARDRDGLAGLPKPGCRIVDLPPFLDTDETLPARTPRAGDPPRLAALAMMRSGDKLASYMLLAEALGRLRDLPWHLEIIGDGPERDAVVAAFAAILPFDRVTWSGTLPRTACLERLAGADLLVWPGFGEAFGMAYLEAQAAGVPVVALDTAGVSAVVKHGETGILVSEPSPHAYAAALRAILVDHESMTRLGAAARRFVLRERTLTPAAIRLDEALRDTIVRRRLTDA